MDRSVKTIAVVQGAPSPEIQDMFRTLVGHWKPSARVVGVIEEGQGQGGASAGGRACRAGQLRSVAGGELYPIFQDLGAGPMACDLDADGAVSACEAVKRDIERGCDLVVLSKFGMLEAEREGLADAFVAALEAEVPVLTCVSPRFQDAWSQFAAPLFMTLPCDFEAIDHWWRCVRLDLVQAGRSEIIEKAGLT